MRKLNIISGLLLTFLASGGPQAGAQTHPPVKLDVDLRDATRRIYHAQMEFAVMPGPLTLVYPKWIPGEHAPNGPIVDLTGLHFRGNGQEISWHRDDVDLFKFHCDVPQGISTMQVSLDLLLPKEDRAGGSPSATAQLAVLQWNLVVLYPEGTKSDDAMFSASVHVPAGWKFATSLTPLTASHVEDGASFETVSLTRLVDSPLLTGAFFKTYDLWPGQKPEHRLNIAADSQLATTVTAEELIHLRQLIAEAGAIFGARHYRHYDFLLALTDHLSPNGLEHHESSDNRAPEKYWLDPSTLETLMDLLPHEYFHSWNGKYRRPAGLATPNYQEPMKGDLLWVYEGLTQYYGVMLTARSGFWTPEQLREYLAATAAYLSNWPGRAWRDLEDTAISSQILYSARQSGASWRRAADYYDESTLIWLEADTIIRRESKGRKSLDDFCRRFHGTEDGAVRVAPYILDDVVTTMNAVLPYDWKKFFDERLHAHGPEAPLGGILNSGWQLSFSEDTNSHEVAEEETSGSVNASFSVGFTVQGPAGDDANSVADVIPGSPAAKAGIAPGMRLIAVNGRRWSPDLLRRAIRDAKNSKEPIELLLENDEYIRTFAVDYHGGERYPHLESTHGVDVLSEIVKHRVPEAVK